MHIRTEAKAQLCAERFYRNRTKGTISPSMTDLDFMWKIPTTPSLTRNHLISRTAHLKALGAKAVDGIQS